MSSNRPTIRASPRLGRASVPQRQRRMRAPSPFPSRAWLCTCGCRASTCTAATLVANNATNSLTARRSFGATSTVTRFPWNVSGHRSLIPAAHAHCFVPVPVEKQTAHLASRAASPVLASCRADPSSSPSLLTSSSSPDTFILSSFLPQLLGSSRPGRR